uniref:PCI domain-containing protein n=1 Tax=Kalanchoe fedtschenkoi TaxID=63787 RepID=A0A7N0UCR1_KALFE
MMNQGGSVHSAASQNPNPVEVNQMTGGAHGYASYYSSITGYDATTWATQRADNGTSGTVIPPNPNYSYAQPTETQLKSVQDTLNVASQDSSGLGVNVPQEYTSYPPHQTSTDPYGYSNTAHQSYYNSYQQPSSHAYSQPVGANPNSGAPYQPISSFQNTGSYAEPASYSSTYYNPGGYQTSSGGYHNQTTAGGYLTSSYNNQMNLWNGVNHSNYCSQQQSYYAPDSNSAYSSTSTASTTVQYQQQCAQWADYYNQTEVSCAPGTEPSTKTATPNTGYAVPGTCDVGSGVQDTYWQQAMPGFPNQHVRPHVDYQKHTDTNPSYNSFQDPQKIVTAQGTNSQYMFVQQVPPNYQPPKQTVPSVDARTVSNIQIPTNPRIASNLPFTPKINKDHPTTASTAKPAYISVSAPKSNEKPVTHNVADSSIKPGIFPKSLRGYVERALTRCKDEEQKAASQAVMKEIITKATADGTLHTRDWDTEPLFAMPESNVTDYKFHSSNIVTSPTLKRSPTRRSKSRWEPMQEEKPLEKPTPVDNRMFKFGGWVPSSDRDKKFQSVKPENREENSSYSKFKYEPKSGRKNDQMQFKRQRLDESVGAATSGDASSDSDKEQSLTAYYSGAITLANTPEEKQRRESRSKRFEGVRHQSESNHPHPRPTSEMHLFTKKARALALNKTYEESTSSAVEDIDWDSLTVKGTCQEIEKRYLRLTCAPDPATVRPEEILEMALAMVQNSQKNYLYKCDQLKSIRQDLTVQRIRNRFTVQVYETHARLALEVGDLPEYNQCQSQLQTLYADGIEGSYMEFSAYNLLCVMLHSKNTRDLVSAMSRLSIDARKDEAVRHALAVRTAVTSENYVLFFKLYQAAPKLHACLMDIYVEKMRFAAIKCMSRSYRPTVPVSYISRVLGFGSVTSTPEADSNDSRGIEECIEWLKAHGAVLTAANNGDMQLDTKGSWSSLFMPEPEDAVPHGDANLAVNDFFTRTL